ncbi:MAG TPA: pseudouridine synthase, partial [Bacteroidetes bacterium]|nr:pseudouridine synthase [Bacteroidota bacterium]
AASWVISPVLGGIIAASFLFAIKKTMIFKENKIEAAVKWVPVFVAIMSWAFVTYLTLKGLKKVWPHIVDILIFLPDTKKPTFIVAMLFGLIVAVLVYITVRATVIKKASTLENSRAGINMLFTVPLIFAAALLSFAHGANDVANAIGPLAAINDAVMTGGISSKAGIPLWVMAVGALGIAIGLALYGPKLIRTYIAFNKPIGIVCTTDPKERKNIINYIGHPERLFPIGRLDKPSEGLIFLTNDGDIVNKILRAGNRHEKEYIVTVKQMITAGFIKKMGQGIPVLGTVTKKCSVIRLNDFTFKIILTQGLNRQIRRMCEYLNYEVVKLKRTRIMNVKLGNLKTGQWRELRAAEMQQINKMLASSSKTEEASFDKNKK